MTLSDRATELAEMLSACIAWANHSAGEGLCAIDPTIRDPEDFLYEYAEATGDQDYETWRRIPGAILEALTHKDAEIARLREALEPFAREAEAWSPENNDGHVFDDNERMDHVDNLRVGHLRRASAALSQEPTR